MEVKSLDTIDFSVLMECFLESFENYFVKMPTDHNFYKERWSFAGVQYDLSYGMFDGDKLVGFIINAIDKRNEDYVAFNTGTGVLPKYRGQGIVQKIYQVALPQLRLHGISKCKLEVIKDNYIAIKAYERIGFKTTKYYQCFSGEITIDQNQSDLKIQKVDATYFDWNAMHQEMYSWDNHYKSVGKGTYDYYVILKDDKPESYFIINPKNGYIPQLNIFQNNDNNWERLFTAIRSITSTIKINNVDKTLKNKIKALFAVKLKNTIDQYEMDMIL